MNIKRTIIGLVAGLSLLAAPQLQAAAYMKLGDIKGEATEPSHAEWITLDSVQLKIALEPESSGSTRLVPRPTPVTCAKELDKASPKIMEALVTGQSIPRVDIHLTRDTAAGEVVYYKYELTNVLISSYSTGGSASGDPLPTEQISLNFEQIKLIYSVLGTTETVEATWNLQDGTTQ